MAFLMIPLVALLIAGVDFGRAVVTRNTLANAVREASRAGNTWPPPAGTSAAYTGNGAQFAAERMCHYVRTKVQAPNTAPAPAASEPQCAPPGSPIQGLSVQVTWRNAAGTVVSPPDATVRLGSVRVEAILTYQPIFPFLASFVPIPLSASSVMFIEP